MGLSDGLLTEIGVVPADGHNIFLTLKIFQVLDSQVLALKSGLLTVVFVCAVLPVG